MLLVGFLGGKFITECGYSHGGIYDEFWNIYQRWEDVWEKIETVYKTVYNESYISKSSEIKQSFKECKKIGCLKILIKTNKKR